MIGEHKGVCQGVDKIGKGLFRIPTICRENRENILLSKHHIKSMYIKELHCSMPSQS